MELNATTSQLAKAILRLKGKPLDLGDYEPLRPAYDSDPMIFTAKAGRQIGKSVFLAARSVIRSIARPYFHSLFISPLSEQTSRFSGAYLDGFLNGDLISKYFRDSGSKKNVYEKSFSNGSRIYLSYGQEENDADRSRGISADSLYLDEVQDISYEMIPAVRETLGASPYGNILLTGTSKSLTNTLEYVWNETNQCEWVIKCDHCGKHNIPLDFESCLAICQGENGPICMHCGGSLDVRKGRWVAFRNDIKNAYGFHLPQFIMPIRTTPKLWADLRSKVKSYTRTRLANECFGIADDVAGRLLTKKECMACCNQDRTEFVKERTDWMNSTISYVVMGVDWAVAGSTKSYSIVSVIGFDIFGKMYLLYAYRFPGNDILAQIAHIETLFRDFNVDLLAVDRGVGTVQFQILKRSLGEERVVTINYVSAKTHLRWDKVGQFYAADRTLSLDSVFIKMKLGRDRFESPRWEIMQTFYQDALNVYEEESNSGKRLYRHHPDQPDDWIHSVSFANIAMMILRGEFTYMDDVSEKVKEYGPEVEG